jgi:hypothetical protein
MTRDLVEREVTNLIRVYEPLYTPGDGWGFREGLSVAQRHGLHFDLELEFLRDIPSLLGSPEELVEWLHQGELPRRG